LGFVGEINSVRRRVRRGLSYLEVQVQRDRSSPVTATHTTPPGDDSYPIAAYDTPVLMPLDQSGRFAIGSYLDTVNPSSTSPGDKRMYSRDEPTGLPVAEVWLHNDGSVQISNAAGSVRLSVGGGVTARNDAGSVALGETGAVDMVCSRFSLVQEIAGVPTGAGLELTSAGVWSVNGGKVLIDILGLVSALNFAAGPVTLLTHVHPAGTLFDSAPLPVTGSTAVGTG